MYHKTSLARLKKNSQKQNELKNKQLVSRSDYVCTILGLAFSLTISLLVWIRAACQQLARVSDFNNPVQEKGDSMGGPGDIAVPRLFNDPQTILRASQSSFFPNAAVMSCYFHC